MNVISFDNVDHCEAPAVQFTGVSEHENSAANSAALAETAVTKQNIESPVHSRTNDHGQVHNTGLSGDAREGYDTNEEESDEEEHGNDTSLRRMPKNGRNGKKNTLTARSIMDLFRTIGRDRGSVGTKKLKVLKRVKDIGNENKKTVVRVLKNIVLKLFQTFLPNDSRGLLFDVVKEIGFPVEQSDVIMKSLRLCRDRSLEERFLRSIIMGNVEKGTAIRLITRYVAENCEQRLDNMPLSKVAALLARQRNANSVNGNDFTASSSAIMRDTEGDRESLSGSSEEESDEHSDDEDEEGECEEAVAALRKECNNPKMYGRLRSGNVRGACRRARNDWKHLSVYGFIQKKKVYADPQFDS